MFTMKNLSHPMNWPYSLKQQAMDEKDSVPQREVRNPPRSKLPLGLKVFRLASQEAAVPVLSHHFAPAMANQKLKKLDSIMSMGEAEEIGTPMLRFEKRSDRGSISTPASKFGTPTQPKGGFTAFQQQANAARARLEHLHSGRRESTDQLAPPTNDMLMAVACSPRRTATRQTTKQMIAF